MRQAESETDASERGMEDARGDGGVGEGFAQRTVASRDDGAVTEAGGFAQPTVAGRDDGADDGG